MIRGMKDRQGHTRIEDSFHDNSTDVPLRNYSLSQSLNKDATDSDTRCYCSLVHSQCITGCHCEMLQVVQNDCVACFTTNVYCTCIAITVTHLGHIFTIYITVFALWVAVKNRLLIHADHSFSHQQCYCNTASRETSILQHVIKKIGGFNNCYDIISV